MKKRLCVLFAILSVCFFTGWLTPGSNTAYAFIKQESQPVIVNSAVELADALEENFENLIEAFELSVNGSLDVDGIMNQLPLFNVESIEWLFYDNIRGNTKKSENSFILYEFKVIYRDDVKVLRAHFNPEFVDSLTEIEVKLLEKAITVIDEIIEPEMEDFDKVLAIHNYLVINGKYDSRENTNSLPGSSYRAEGILLHGVGVCGSYASAMNLLLGIAEIESVFVAGEAEQQAGEPESHAWNKVKIDGEWYNVDVTWNDPVPDNPEEVSYVYLNVTDDMLALDHTWNEDDYPQKANSTRYNYYIYNQLLATDYKQFMDAILNAIQKQSGEDEITFCIYVKNYDPNTYDLNFIFDAYPNISEFLYTKLTESEGEMLFKIYYER